MTTVPVPDIPDEKLLDLARDIAAGRIFTDRHIRPDEWANMVPSIFRPIGLAGLGDIDPETIGLLYAPLAEAGPRSVNGYPCFFAVNFLNRRQTEQMLRAAQRIEEAAHAVSLEGSL